MEYHQCIPLRLVHTSTSTGVSPWNVDDRCLRMCLLDYSFMGTSMPLGNTIRSDKSLISLRSTLEGAVAVKAVLVVVQIHKHLCVVWRRVLVDQIAYFDHQITAGAIKIRLSKRIRSVVII